MAWLVGQLGKRAGVSVRPRQLRASFVTNLMLEDGLAGRRVDLNYMNTTGGWALGSTVPQNSYASSAAMGAGYSHIVRSPHHANRNDGRGAHTSIERTLLRRPPLACTKTPGHGRTRVHWRKRCWAPWR